MGHIIYLFFLFFGNCDNTLTFTAVEAWKTDPPKSSEGKKGQGSWVIEFGYGAAADYALS